MTINLIDFFLHNLQEQDWAWLGFLYRLNQWLKKADNFKGHLSPLFYKIEGPQIIFQGQFCLVSLIPLKHYILEKKSAFAMAIRALFLIFCDSSPKFEGIWHEGQPYFDPYVWYLTTKYPHNHTLTRCLQTIIPVLQICCYIYKRKIFFI